MLARSVAAPHEPPASSSSSWDQASSSAASVSGARSPSHPRTGRPQSHHCHRPPQSAAAHRLGHQCSCSGFSCLVVGDQNCTEQHVPEPPRLVTLVFGDVAPFVDGSVNARAVTYIGIVKFPRPVTTHQGELTARRLVITLVPTTGDGPAMGGPSLDGRPSMDGQPIAALASSCRFTAAITEPRRCPRVWWWAFPTRPVSYLVVPRLPKREHIIAAARVVVGATISASPQRGAASEGEHLTFIAPFPVVLLIPANRDIVGQDIIAAEKVVVDATSSARPRRGAAREGEHLTFIAPFPVVLLIPANRDVLDQDIIAAARVVVAATSSASPQRGEAREGEHLTFITPFPVVLGSHRLIPFIRRQPGRAAWQDPLRVDQGGLGKSAVR
jgi:hypothetical protein